MSELLLVLMLNNANLIQLDMTTTEMLFETGNYRETNPIAKTFIDQKRYNELMFLTITSSVIGTVLLNEINPVFSYAFNVSVGLAEIVLPFVLGVNRRAMNNKLNAKFTMFYYTF